MKNCIKNLLCHESIVNPSIWLIQFVPADIRLTGTRSDVIGMRLPGLRTTWSTPIRGICRSERLSEGNQRTITCTLLKKRSLRRGEEDLNLTPLSASASAPPVRRLFTMAPVKSNFLFFSTEKEWRKELDKTATLPPYVSVGLRIPWREQSCPLCNTGNTLASAKEGHKHIKDKHRARKVDWYCSKCHRVKPSLRSAACHVAKCGPVSKLAGPKPFDCDNCPSSFASKRGLSLHMRRKHTAIYLTRFENRNSKRGPAHTPSPVVEIIDLTTPTSIDEARPSALSMRRFMELITKDGDIPAKGLHPLKSSPRVVNLKLQSYITAMKQPKCLRNNTATRRKHLTHKRKKWSKSAKRRMLQAMWSKDVAAVASFVLDKIEMKPCKIGKAAVESAYVKLWEGIDKYKHLGVFRCLEPANNEAFHTLITPEEVVSKLKGMNEKSAPGPDRIRKSHLVEWDKEGKLLACFFNTLLYNGKLPKRLKGSITTLVPKCLEEDKLESIENWRPITLSSVILRLFSKLLSDRIQEACPTHQSQKGFLKGEGCGSNLMVVNGLIKRAWRRKESLALVFIDLARAFDSISHRLIKEVLEARGVDEGIRNLISDSYRDSYSRVKSDGGLTRKIFLKVGVKQGDPLSPILFNLGIDPLLSFLENHGAGFLVDGKQITTLAYADDLVIVSNSWSGMVANLRILDRFLSNTGLQVKIHKCNGFYLRGRKGQVTVNACDPWLIGDLEVPMLSPQDSTKYLGMEISPISGILPANLEDDMSKILKRIGDAPLKPTQRLQLLKGFGIPRILYRTVMGMVNMTDLRNVDQKIRGVVKKWLHLIPAINNGVLYTRQRDGGLGLQKLEKQVPIFQLKHWAKMLQSENERDKALATAFFPKKEMAIRWTAVFGNPPHGKTRKVLSKTDHTKIGTSWRNEEHQRWVAMRSQGRGVNSFKEDPLSNSWLPHPEKLGQSEFILAVRLRSNTFNNRTTLNRGQEGDNRCRLCKKGWEGLPHIVSSCEKFQKLRMQNHNQICTQLAIEAGNLGWKVRREKRITDETLGTAVPDLIMTKERIGLVIDVTIGYEMRVGTLARRAKRKSEKYGKFGPAIADRFGLTQVHTYGFPMGARGKWYGKNMEVLQMLGVPKAKRKMLAKKLAVQALRGTIKILKMFKMETRH
uniref:ribonuclease H n=1 Tax=Poecilia reticulata TaxID=8081 RepID=A0A3P9NEF4_POERE